MEVLRAARTRKQLLKAVKPKRGAVKYQMKTMTVEAVGTAAFKEAEGTGRPSRLTVFGECNVRSQARDSTMLAANAILEQQHAALQQLHERGGDFCCLHWEFDGTPQKVDFNSMATVQRLLGRPADEEQNAEAAHMAGVREVLVQRGIFITEAACDDVFARPLVLGDQTSLTNLNALMHELGFLNLDLQKLSSSYKEVILHFSIDGSPTVELVVDYVRELVKPLGNVIVCNNTSCMMHALNRIIADHSTKKDSQFDLSGVLSLTKLMHISAYFDKFAQSVKECATEEDFHWEQYGPADADSCRQHRRAVDLCLPELKEHPK